MREAALARISPQKFGQASRCRSADGPPSAALRQKLDIVLHSVALAGGDSLRTGTGSRTERLVPRLLFI